MSAPSLSGVDAQFEAIFGRNLLPDIAKPVPLGHEFTEDGICSHCGYEGADFHHWKHHTPEGLASDATCPPCA